MRYRSVAFIKLSGLSLIVLSSLVNCGPKSHPETRENFLEIPYARQQRLMNFVKRPINFQYTGSPGINEDVMKKSVMKWLEPLRSLSDDITREVSFSRSGSFDVKAKFMSQTGRAHANPFGKEVTLYKGDGEWVLTHELGHSFGLADTYDPNSRVLRCKSGQPDSVMCTGRHDNLLPDDIAGIRKIFCDHYPQDCEGKNIETIISLAKQKIGSAQPTKSGACPEASDRDDFFECDDSCNVRPNPGVSNQPMGKATLGSRYKVLAHACQKSTRYIWYKIDYNGQEAWVWSLRYF